MLFMEDGEPFATGAVMYRYGPAGQRDANPRILIPVELEGFATFAVLDTGSPYVMVAPAIAQRLGLDPANALEQTRITHRNNLWNGGLHRIEVKFVATQGMTPVVDATAFVPDVSEMEPWGDMPSFLGLTGCLERLRFAVDPGTDTFYVGALNES